MPNTNYISLKVNQLEAIQIDPEHYWIDQEVGSNWLKLTVTRKCDNECIELTLKAGGDLCVPMAEVQKALQEFDLERLVALRDLYKDVSLRDGVYVIKCKHPRVGFAMKQDGYWYKKFDTRQAFLDYALPL